jgi:hypothetical protein
VVVRGIAPIISPPIDEPELVILSGHGDNLASVKQADLDALGGDHDLATLGPVTTTDESAESGACRLGRPNLGPGRDKLRRDYLRTRNRRMVTASDRVLSSGSRFILARPGEE